jgi:tRNA1(Val) A37 N6-methylase TrmN6
VTEETVEDAILGGRLRLRQPARGHRAGTDAVLLAASIGLAEGVLCDAGAGVGAVGLAAALRAPALRVTLIERDPLTASLARVNVGLNGLDDRVSVAEADLTQASARRDAGLTDGFADFVATNPPWLEPGRARVSPNQRRAAAHAHEEGGGGLETWMRAVAALTRPGGQMALIHRADHLEEALRACEGRFGALSVLPIHPRAGEAAHRIIVRGVKGSRAPLRILPGLTLHEGAGFTPLVEALHRGEAMLGEG